MFPKKGIPLPYLLTLPVVVALVILLIYPTVYAFFMCFYSTVSGIENFVFVGFENFKTLFSSKEFYQDGLNTFLFTIGSVGISFVLGFAIALLLNSISFGVGIYRTIFILPLGVTPVVAGLTWNMLLNPLYGIANFFLEKLGFQPLGWTTDLKMALPSVIMIDVWQWTPFMMLVLYAGLQMLPREPYEAALIDGAGSFQSFCYITLPLLKPIITIAVVLRGLEAFKAFDVIYTVTKGGPGRATETWIVRAYMESFRFHRMEMGAVIGIVMLVITILVCQRIVKVLEQ